MDRLQHRPRFHTSVTVPTTGRLGGMRVLVTPDGMLAPLIEFFLVPERRGLSAPWQAKIVQSVGLLYDYTKAKPPPDGIDPPSGYLTEFVEDLIAGTVQPDGSDATGLYWPGAGRQRVSEVLRHLNSFSDFCSKNYGVHQMNPWRSASLGERLATLYAAERRDTHSLFAHLGNARARCRENIDDVTAGAGLSKRSHMARVVGQQRQHRVVSSRPPFFPAGKDLELFSRGFAVRRSRVAAPWMRHNIRDLMIALLQRYGGLRPSEPFHLYVRDVIEDPVGSGRAKVLLYHPEEGLARYKDPLTGSIIETKRSVFLNRFYNGMIPRSKAAGSPSYAGWKDLMLEKGEPHLYATVHWLSNDAASMFWRLYVLYVRRVRPRGVNHPFLFCTHHGTHEGMPYPYDEFGKAFTRAVARIGLVSKKDLGTTPHGLRHAYAQDLRRLLGESGVADASATKIIQICLHHKSPHSQMVYTQPELREVSEALEAANSVYISNKALHIIPDINLDA